MHFLHSFKITSSFLLVPFNMAGNNPKHFNLQDDPLRYFMLLDMCIS